MGMEPRSSCGPSPPKEALQEEESKMTKQDQRPGAKEKVLHANLPSTSSPYRL